MDELGNRMAGIAWFLPENGSLSVDGASQICAPSGGGGVHPQYMASPVSDKNKNGGVALTSSPYAVASRRRRRRRHNSTKAVEDGVDVIDIEDEDHSFTSFFVGVRQHKSNKIAAGAAQRNGIGEIKRPMVHTRFP